MGAEVLGAGGVRLAVTTAGQRAAPAIVLVHGWAQSSRVWSSVLAERALIERFRLIAVDLRGHGESGVPSDGYADPRVWAGDLAAVLKFAEVPVVLVGYSYGALVITDYLRVYGTKGVAGLVFVGGITELGKGHPGGQTGAVMRSALPDALNEDHRVAVPALSALIEGMTATPLRGSVTQALLGTSLLVPPAVRSALFRRDIGSAAVLAEIDVPSLIMHGTEDAVVDPAAAEYAIGKIPGAQSRWLQGVGHLPFAEAGAEFTSALRLSAQEWLAH